MSKYEKTESGGEGSRYDRRRFQKMANIILRFLQSQNTSIFEIGCANGQLLAFVKDKGYNKVSGINPSPVSVETARRNYGIRVSANTLSDVKIKDATVDFLVLLGVFEHVRDLTSLCRPSGRCCLLLVRSLSLFQMHRVILKEKTHLTKNLAWSILTFQPYFTYKFDERKWLQTDLFTTRHYQIQFQNYHAGRPWCFQKSDDQMPFSYIIDSITEPDINLYIQQSGKVDNEIQAVIDKVVGSGRPLIFWGTGAHTLRLLSTSKLGQAKIRAFSNSNPRYQGKQLNGAPIIPLGD